MGWRTKLYQEGSRDRSDCRVDHKGIGLNKNKSQAKQSPLGRVLSLQRTFGNRAVKSAQSKLLSRTPSRRIQRSLVANGDGAGFASLANSAIGVQFEVVVSAAGNVTLRTTNTQGPLTSAAQELVNVLRTVINDSHATTIEFVRGAANVIVGSYQLSRVDLDDIAAFGGARGQGLSAGTALAHEITEQYRKQVHREAFPVAHAAGLASEARAAGATITPGPMRQVSPGVVEINDVYTYPDGSRERVTIQVTRGNVSNVTRTRLP